MITNNQLKQISASYETTTKDADILNILGYLESNVDMDLKSHTFADEARKSISQQDPNISFKYSEDKPVSSKTLSRDCSDHEKINAVSSLLNALPQFEGTLFDVVLKFYKLNYKNELSNDAFYMILKSRVQNFEVPFPSIQDTIEFKVGGRTIKRPAYKVNYPTNLSFEILEDGAFTLYTFFNHFRKIDIPYEKGQDVASRANDIIGYYTNNGYTFDLIVLINRDPVLQDNPVILPKDARTEAKTLFPGPKELPKVEAKEDLQDDIGQEIAKMPKNPDENYKYTWGITTKEGKDTVSVRSIDERDTQEKSIGMTPSYNFTLNR